MTLRISAAALLCLLACKDPPAPPPAPPGSPAAATHPDSALLRFHLTDEKVLKLRSAKAVDGTIVRQGTTLWRYTGPRTVDGRTGHSYSHDFQYEEGGQKSRVQMTALQHVDDRRSYTLGAVFPDADPWWDPHPFVDLAAPLEKGSEWSFSVPSLYYAHTDGNKPMMKYRRRITKTDVSVEVPAGTFTGCLETETEASTDAPGTMECRGKPREANIKRTSEIWFCPELGNVKESSRIVVVTTDGVECSMTESKTVLVKIGS